MLHSARYPFQRSRPPRRRPRYPSLGALISWRASPGQYHLSVLLFTFRRVSLYVTGKGPDETFFYGSRDQNKNQRRAPPQPLAAGSFHVTLYAPPIPSKTQGGSCSSIIVGILTHAFESEDPAPADAIQPSRASPMTGSRHGLHPPAFTATRVRVLDSNQFS